MNCFWQIRSEKLKNMRLSGFDVVEMHNRGNLKSTHLGKLRIRKLWTSLCCELVISDVMIPGNRDIGFFRYGKDNRAFGQPQIFKCEGSANRN